MQASSGRVIAGNGRLAVMRRLGWLEADIVELDVDDLTATALGIALNRTGELATWHDDVLAKLLAELRTEDALSGVGFSSDEIDALLAELAEQEPGPEVDDPECWLPSFAAGRLPGQEVRDGQQG